MSVDVELVFQDDVSHLFYLVSLGLAADGLQVENLFNAGLVEDDVTATALSPGESTAFNSLDDGENKLSILYLHDQTSVSGYPTEGY